MEIPDFLHLDIGQIAGYLMPLAVLVFAAGFLRAATSLTVLWTYTGDWIMKYLGPTLVLLVTALVGQGIPGLTESNGIVGTLVFIPAVLAFVATCLASIAKNFGLDLSKLPLAQNVKQVFEPEKVVAPPVAVP